MVRVLGKFIHLLSFSSRLGNTEGAAVVAEEEEEEAEEKRKRTAGGEFPFVSIGMEMK